VIERISKKFEILMGKKNRASDEAYTASWAKTPIKQGKRRFKTPDGRATAGSFDYRGGGTQEGGHVKDFDLWGGVFGSNKKRATSFERSHGVASKYRGLRGD